MDNDDRPEILIDTLKSRVIEYGNLVVARLRVDFPDYAHLPDAELRDRKCLTINTAVAVELINRERIPVMAYTLSPIDRSIFKTNNPHGWVFHTVGIAGINPDSYLVFDQSSPQIQDEEGDCFSSVGTLLQVSEVLNERFGGQWLLDFDPKSAGMDPFYHQRSVRAKISNARSLITQRQLSDSIQFIDSKPSINSKSFLGLRYNQPKKPATSLQVIAGSIWECANVE